jgi:hypothetical protein
VAGRERLYQGVLSYLKEAAVPHRESAPATIRLHDNPDECRVRPQPRLFLGEPGQRRVADLLSPQPGERDHIAEQALSPDALFEPGTDQMSRPESRERTGRRPIGHGDPQGQGKPGGRPFRPDGVFVLIGGVRATGGIENAQGYQSLPGLVPISSASTISDGSALRTNARACSVSGSPFSQAIERM